MLINIFEIILLGGFATLFMDFSAIVLSKMKIIQPLIEPKIVGRWVLLMLRGEFIHKDISQRPELKFEKETSILAHYIIGFALAAVYLSFEYFVPVARDQIIAPIIFGLLTVLLPWLWLYPSIGLGFLAMKAEKKLSYIITSLVNHFNFGIGLAIWIEFT